MKILFVVSFFHTNLAPWVKALVEAGCEVKMICRKREPTEDNSIITPSVVDASLMNEAAMGEILASFMPDLVILRDKSDSFRALAKRASKEGAKVVYYEMRGYLRKSGVLGFLNDLKRLSRRVRNDLPMLTITPAVGPKSGVPRKFARHFYIPMSVCPDALDRKYCSLGVPTVLCVGKLAHQVKRQTWVIDALEELQIPCRLLLVGSGDDRAENPDKREAYYYDELRERARDHRIPGEVRVIEDMPYRDLLKFYGTCDVKVLPSERELFGISIIEAMAGGCAVVATDAAGATNYIEHGHDGLHFDSNSYQDFVNQLYRLLSDPKEIEHLGRNAVNTILTNHNLLDFSDFVKSLAPSVRNRHKNP